MQHALNPNTIRMLNWNIAKGRLAGWAMDLKKYAHHADLLLIQEASLEHKLPQLLDEQFVSAFAPGYSRAGHIASS